MRTAKFSEKVAGHLESLDADEILTRSAQLEKIDTVARRTFGLDDTASGNGAVNLNVLWGGRAIVQVNQKTSSVRRSARVRKASRRWAQVFSRRSLACAIEARTLLDHKLTILFRGSDLS